MIRKVLVCNRGEIAVRIIRACRDLGIATVAVHSSADADSLPVQMADETFCLGRGSARDSYLNIPAVLYAAAATGADALHPGYGFLSEDHLFASTCAEAGLTFIGPPPTIISMMGDKAEARAMMAASGVPMSAGIGRSLRDADDAEEVAAGVGYPVMLKAAAGGGGRGMKIVHDASTIRQDFASVQRDAGATFLDDRVYLERFIRSARHVEIQVLADSYGNVVHLGERDCSIQRRQQKLVEESPSAVLSDDLRERMGTAAVQAAAAIGYVSAGTVEFLVDGDGEFYFMEMNTRIQVEHPVTEMRSGIDLVQWMIRIADGEPLGFTQDDIRPRGHAIEFRLNCEDPALGWRGSSGTIGALHLPSGPGVRVDSHAFSGYRIPPFYDSLLAKLVVHGETREEALRVAERALDEFVCEGVTTTAGFHRDLVQHPTFRDGTYRLDFVERFLGADGRLTPTQPLAS